MRDSRSTNKWDLYRAYFKNHRDGELERCGLEDGNDVDCWPTFRTQYGDSTEAFLRVALDLDRPANYGVTPQQQSQNFQEHCAKIKELNQEGLDNRFQTLTVVVGECLQEDQSNSAILATP
ncbi:hypothetical protein C0992_000193, partial [Termitomyces sp. T32_za158]